MTTIERVTKLLDQGQESAILSVIERLEAKASLPSALSEKLDALGNTPVAEPKVYEAINSGDAITVALNVLSEDEIKKYEAVEIGTFIHEVEQKITGYKDANGIFKSTPNTEDCRLPNFMEADQIRKLFIKQNTLMKEWGAASDAKAKAKISKSLGETSEALSALIMGISGLDTESLTDWEQALVVTQISGAANNAFLTAQGKPYAN